jgi:hypothetical protein
MSVWREGTTFWDVACGTRESHAASLNTKFRSCVCLLFRICNNLTHYRKRRSSGSSCRQSVWECKKQIHLDVADSPISLLALSGFCMHISLNHVYPGNMKAFANTTRRLDFPGLRRKASQTLYDYVSLMRSSCARHWPALHGLSSRCFFSTDQTATSLHFNHGYQLPLQHTHNFLPRRRQFTFLSYACSMAMLRFAL